MSHLTSMPVLGWQLLFHAQAAFLREKMKINILDVQSDTMIKLCTLIRLGRLEYMTHELLATVPAYLATDKFHWPAFLAIVVASLIQMPATSYTNYYTDQIEDHLNAPERVALCEIATYKNIKRVAFILWVLALLWGVVLVFVANITTVWIYYLGTFVRFNYSLGIRFKRHFALMIIPYALSPLMLFAFAWTVNKPLSSLPPVAFILGFESAVLCCTIKNIPDALGDREAGRKTPFTETAHLAGIPPLVASLTPFIWFSTHALIICLLLFGALAPRYLAVFLTLPMVIYGVRRMRQVQGIGDKEALFQYTFFYSLVFDTILIFAFSPTLAVFITLAALLAYSQLVSYLMAREQYSFLRFYTR